MTLRVPYTPGQLADASIDSPAASILVMMLLLAVLDFIRSGFTFDRFTRRRVMGYFLAGFGFLALALVSPDVARAIVFGILALTMLSMAGPLADFIDGIAGRLTEPTPTTGTRPV